MSDHRPQALATGERETLLSLLQFQRESFLRKVDGVDDVTARSSPLPSGTSLLWLTHHLAFAEQVWLVRRFRGEELAVENAVAPDETVADAVALYRDTWARSDGIVATAALDEMCRIQEGGNVNLRWILAHLLEETARHAGHADILREMIDGSAGR
jgi:hypothetical protein